MDVICCNRMLRRSFWEEQDIRFPEGVAYEDHVPMMQAFVRARRFDVLRDGDLPLAHPGEPHLHGSAQAGGAEPAGPDRRQEQAAALLQETSPRVRDAWIRRVLDLDMHGFVRQLEWAEDEYWRSLRGGARVSRRRGRRGVGGCAGRAQAAGLAAGR